MTPPRLYDDIHELHDHLPVVLGFVAVLAFVLLLAAFRSVAVPLMSIALNLLSVGAAYGLVTLIFQDGRLQGPLGLHGVRRDHLLGAADDVRVPVRHQHGLPRVHPQPDPRAVGARLRAEGRDRRGHRVSSAGVVTSAALIMVAVFSIFATLPLIDLKILGIGTASAVLIDATIVRGILVPAALALLGDRAWGRRARHAPLTPTPTPATRA